MYNTWIVNYNYIKVMLAWLPKKNNIKAMFAHPFAFILNLTLHLHPVCETIIGQQSLLFN